MTAKRANVTVDFDPEIRAELERRARRAGMKLSPYIRRLVLDSLGRENAPPVDAGHDEDEEWRELAAKTARDVALTRDRLTIALAAFMNAFADFAEGELDSTALREWAEKNLLATVKGGGKA